MFKLFGYEVSFKKEETAWAGEDMTQRWDFILSIERITPTEARHREFLFIRDKQQRMNEKKIAAIEEVIKKYCVPSKEHDGVSPLQVATEAFNAAEAVTE